MPNKNQENNTLTNRTNEDGKETNQASNDLESKNEKKSDKAPVNEKMSEIQDNSFIPDAKDDENPQTLNQNGDNQGVETDDTSSQNENQGTNVLTNIPSEDDEEINHTNGNLEDESEQKNDEASVNEEMNQIQDSTSISNLKDNENSQVLNRNNEDNQVVETDGTSKQINSKSENKPKDTTSQKESESKESKKSYVLPCMVGSCTALAIAYFMRIQFPSPHVTVAVFIGIALVGALVAYGVAKLFDNDDKMQTKLEEPSISQDKVHIQGV